MRLGDLDALKENGTVIAIVNGKKMKVVPVKCIDNALTVEAIPLEVHEKAMNIAVDDLFKVQEELNRIRNEKRQGEWIPVSERLPNWWEVVLVTDECGKVFEYERRPVDEDGNLCREWTFLGRNIIAWMPLPEPYKKGGAE